jgi:hypothetical protein
MILVITILIILSSAIFFLIIYLRINNRKLKVISRPVKQRIEEVFHRINSPVHVYIAVCDYFQPFSGNASQEIAEHRVVTWCKEYSRLAKLHTDSSGKFPVHSLFYSEEDYNPQLLDRLYRPYKENLTDIEIMLPVANEPADRFRRKLEEFRDVLFHHHGYLRKGADEKICYGFSYGVKPPYAYTTEHHLSNTYNRIKILIDTGCFADFTCYINRHGKKKLTTSNSNIHSENENRTGSLSSILPQDWTIKNLLTIQDPGVFKWNTGTLRIFPFFENGEISAIKKFLPFRADLWLQNCIGIETQVKHLFVKLHTFGGLDQNIRYLLGEHGLHLMWNYIEKLCSSNNFVLHYVSAWEMFTSISSICRGNALKNRKTITTL